MTTWTSVPAGVLGQGNTAVRPYPGVAVCPVVEPMPGTGLPAVAFTGEARAAGGDVVRLRAPHGPVAVLARTDAPAARTFIVQHVTQHDGTILGIRTPGRPKS